MKQEKMLLEGFSKETAEEGCGAAYGEAVSRAEEGKAGRKGGRTGAERGWKAPGGPGTVETAEEAKPEEASEAKEPSGQPGADGNRPSCPHSPSVAQKSPKEVEEELNAYLTGEGNLERPGGKTGWKQKRMEKKRQKREKMEADGSTAESGRWTRKRKRRAAAAAAVLAAAFFVKSLAGRGEALQVPSMTLERGDVVSTLSLTGPVSGTESADVVSNLHAEVLEIRVKEGDRVEKGQVLAVIDRADAQREVDIARNSYELAVSEYNENIRDTRNGYEKAVQDCNTAKLDYDRTKALFDTGAASLADLESAENALNDARRAADGFTVENGQAVPDKSYELKIQSARFELEQKERELEDTEVKSPISGTVVRVNSKVGQFADKPEDEKPMFIVENLDQLNMELQISEYSVGKVSVGLPVEITADILDGKTASGTITSISPTGEEKAGGGSSERVVPTTVSIDDPSGSLIAGITARATVVTGKAENVFKVPITAVLNGEDGVERIAVLSEETGTVHLLPVETGTQSDLETEIAPADGEALREGMTVLLSPAGLAEGMEVEPV